MRRFGLAFAVLGLVVLAALAWAVSQSWQSAERRVQGERRLIAERLFDEFERVLAVFIDREGQRPVTHYRYFHVPAELLPGSVAIGLSPLATGPAEPFVRGYLQWDPDGRLGSPQVPENDALRQQLGLSVDPSAVAWLEDWRAWTRQRPAALAACLPAATALPDPVLAKDGQQQERQRMPAVGGAAAPVATPALDDSESSVQIVQIADGQLPQSQALQQRIRGVFQADDVNGQRTMQLSAQSVDEYVNPVDNIGKKLYLSNSWQLLNDFAPVPEEQRVGKGTGTGLSSWNRSVLDQFGSSLDQALQVTIDPFQGSLIDADRLLLLRQIAIDGRRSVQGIVIDLRRLVASLEDTVLDAELREAATIDWHWGGDSSTAPFTQRLPAPFEVIAVGCALPGLQDESDEFVALLSIASLVAVAVVLGFFLIGRGVAGRMEYARRRQDFVAAVSHELRTPLTSIRLYGEMLRDGLVADDDKRQRYYQTITGESERLSRLIDNVLTLARLERGEAHGALTTGSVADCLDEVVAVIGPHCRAQGFELVVACAENLPPVTLERDGLIQALLNLIDNSVKFSAGHQPRRIELHAAADGQRVRLVLRDHGPGVPAAQCERLVEPFFRGERELTRRTRGTGIGLALVDRLIRGMGGSFSLGNHPGGGLRVELWLPVAE